MMTHAEQLSQARALRWQRDPTAVGRRTLIAKTCRSCGELLPAERFGKIKGYYAGTCRACTQRAYYARKPRSDLARKFRSDYQNLQRRNIPGEHHREPWTGPELEIAARSDLSTREVAEMLGRTYLAVKQARYLLKIGDPRLSKLAGLNKP